ncbi:MAG: alpha/beta hydrolase [Rhizobiaceae bacterium]
MSESIDYSKEYDNSGRVANSEELVDAYIEDAATFREQSRHAQYDLSYGPQPRNKLDIFWPRNESDCPIVVFIHGGYWQRLDRSAFSHMAKGLNAVGVAVAIPSYTLAPDISVSGIINEMRRTCLTLYQTYKRRLTVIGHSAGGHLAACMIATDWQAIHPDLPHDLVASGMGISGIYDLLPLLQTPVNDALGMDEAAALAASPMSWLPDAMQRFEAWVGAEESSEYHRQSRKLAANWTLLGTPTDYVSVKGANHFTIIHDLTKSDSYMVLTILDLVEKPVQEIDLPEPDDEEMAAVLAGTYGIETPDAEESAESEPEDDGEDGQLETDTPEEV